MIEDSGYSYACRAGDSFDLIALCVYGHEKYARELINANPAYADVLIFSGGEELTLPVVAVPDGDSAYMPSRPPWKG